MKVELRLTSISLFISWINTIQLSKLCLISQFLREIEEQKVSYMIKCLNFSAIPVTIMEFWRVDGQRSIPRTAQYPGSGQEVSQSSKSTTLTATSPYDMDSAGCFPVFLPQVRIKKTLMLFKINLSPREIWNYSSLSDILQCVAASEYRPGLWQTLILRMTPTAAWRLTAIGTRTGNH